ncbi:MAG: O-antigen ligase family protein [Thermodesulfobacteriota bacterium]
MVAATAKAFAGRAQWADVCFRLGRLFLLVLIFIMPMEAITAAREVGLVGAALFLALNLLLDPERRLRATPLWLPILAYAAIAALSLVWAMDFRYTLKELRAEVLKGVVMYYAAAHFVHHERHLTQAWQALLAGAAVMGLAALVLFATYGGNPLEPFVRAGSLHSGYGSFGTYLVQVWPYLLLFGLAQEGARWRWAWLGLVLLAALSGYLTFSRAVWLAMVVQLGLCVLVTTHHRLRSSVIVAAACLLILVGLFFSPGSSHGERWHKLWEQPEEVGGTAGDLVAVWRFSFDKIGEDPWRGIGLGRHSFSKAFPEFRQTHQPLLWHAHNMFVDLALQLGLPGLAAILAVMIVLAASLWPRSPPGRGDVAGLWMAATAVMVMGFCLRNLFDDFFVDDTGLFFWLLGGLAMGARAGGLGKPHPAPGGAADGKGMEP